MTTAAEPLSQIDLSLRFDIDGSEHDDGLSAFTNMRPRLFGIAYRILKSSAQAEDIVQDVWLRWQSANRNIVEDPPAFLATTTTRLCINLVQSAHSRCETCIGPQLPEPVDTSCDPESYAERSEALRRAVKVLLEILSPSERAAYILREAFDYSYGQIAAILQMGEANTRQIVSRARKHIAAGRRIQVNSGDQGRLLEAFISAAEKGDMSPLEELFAEDAHRPLFDSGIPGISEGELQQVLPQGGYRISSIFMAAHRDQGSQSPALKAGTPDSFQACKYA